MLSLSKLKSLNMEELFFPRIPLPPICIKPHNTFHPPFEFLYLEPGRGWEEKVWNERRHRMIYLECKSFLPEACGSPRFCVNFVETIRISFVPLSSLDIEYLPPPSYQLFTPLFLAKAETSPFFRAEEFISWRTFSFVLLFSPAEWLLVRGEEGKRRTDFEGKLWIFTGRARAYQHSRGYPLKFISEYRWNSGTRRVEERGNRRADRKISLETMFCGKGFGRWGSLLNLERRDAKGNCRGSTYMGSLLENWSGGDMNF